MAQDAALRKRQQIAKASQVMFLWVTAASVVVGISIVVSVFLAQKLFFNEKILSAKQGTVDTLKANNSVVDELKKKIGVLNTNQLLLNARTDAEKALTDDESRPLQVVLDALPAEANTTALGSSLQEVLLKMDNVTIETLTIDPIGGDPNTGSGTAPSEGSVITFKAAVSAPDESTLRALLTKIEKSIRPINILSLNIEKQGTKLLMTMNAQAFFEPGKTTDLKDKVIRP